MVVLRNEFVNYAILIPLYCYTNDRIIRNDTRRIKYLHLKRNECIYVNPTKLKLAKTIKIIKPNLKIAHYSNYLCKVLTPQRCNVHSYNSFTKYYTT